MPEEKWRLRELEEPARLTEAGSTHRFQALCAPHCTTQLPSPEGGNSSEPWRFSPQAWRPQLPSPVLGFGKYQLLSLSPKKRKKSHLEGRGNSMCLILTWPRRGSFPAAACLPSSPEPRALVYPQWLSRPVVCWDLPVGALPSLVPEFSDPFCQCSAPGPGHLPRPGSKTQPPTPGVSWLPDWPPCHPLSSSSSGFPEHS